jgi:phosphotransferase system HPr (HPr) family protein
MPRLEKDIVVKKKQGLHARPAASFVQIASKYSSKVTVQKGSEKVNGASIMGLLTLGANYDCVIKVAVDGSDAEKVMRELEEFLSKEEEV